MTAGGPTTIGGAAPATISVHNPQELHFRIDSGVPAARADPEGTDVAGRDSRRRLNHRYAAQTTRSVSSDGDLART